MYFFRYSKKKCVFILSGNHVPKFNFSRQIFCVLMSIVKVKGHVYRYITSKPNMKYNILDHIFQVELNIERIT